MGLINQSITAEVQYVRIRANNADEMLQKLVAAAAAADAAGQTISDFELFATGAAPNFLAMLTLGDGSASSPTVAPNLALFQVFGGAQNLNSLKPSVLAQQVAEAVRSDGGAALLNKFVMAGGGAGPHWMAAAIYEQIQA